MVTITQLENFLACLLYSMSLQGMIPVHYGVPNGANHERGITIIYFDCTWYSMINAVMAKS